MAPASSKPSFQIRTAQTAKSRSTLRDVQMPTLPVRPQARVMIPPAPDPLPSPPPKPPAPSIMDQVAPRLSLPLVPPRPAAPPTEADPSNSSDPFPPASPDPTAIAPDSAPQDLASDRPATAAEASLAPTQTEPTPSPSVDRPLNTPSSLQRERSGAAPSYATITVQPFTVTTDPLKEPSLPKVKSPGFTQHRHSSNPSFAMSLLQDIATVVQQWQLELEEVHNQIQAIYMEGPIVDGWLEADTTPDGAVKGYRLCGLNQNGQLWSRPCPPDQLPGLSVAIARYQTLRQTMAHKHRLEVRLKQLGETLAVLRSRL